MNMSTKEELVIENTRLKNKLALYREINHRQACIIKESLELNKPCQEYALYEPQPYKFEDLKEGMWVFDNKICDCIKIELILKDKKILCCDGFHRKFEEGRFFPITKALQYQEV